MSSSDRIIKFIERLSESAGAGAPHPDADRSSAFRAYCRSIDLESYKSNQSWPGRKYILVGNSFFVERRVCSTTDDTRRAACIAMVVERGRGNRNCVSVEDALEMPGFVESLSRFEKDWLRRQPPSTLIGPAFGSSGELLPHAFAVWRRDECGAELRPVFHRTLEKSLVH